MKSIVVDAKGVKIKFPYDPYPCQVTYMDSVVTALQNSTNALLESPTGTGKTLCLLCSTLAWRDAECHKGLPPPRVIFSSRTHTQLAQVAHELRRTAYPVRACTLGSRAQMCVHPSISKVKGPLQGRICSSQGRRQKRCAYWAGYDALQQCENSLAEADERIPTIADVEDLVSYGRTNTVCPYYLSNALCKRRDVILTPYNYIIDRKRRKMLEDVVGGSVVIFDEAHNLDASCTEVISFEATSESVRTCIEQGRRCPASAFATQSFDDLCAFLEGLDTRLQEAAKAAKEKAKALIKKGGNPPYNGEQFSGPWIRDLFEDLGLTEDNYMSYSEAIGQISDLVNRPAMDSAGAAVIGGDDDENDGDEDGDIDGNGKNRTSEITLALDSLDTMVRTAFEVPREEADQYFKAYVEQQGIDDWLLGFWCFSPAVSMRSLVTEGKVRSVILTSGTLSPLSSIEAELGINFPVKLENPHVVPDENVWAGVLGKSPSGCALNSSLKTRENPEYLTGLGQVLINISRIVPAGVLVFFPSYSVLIACVEMWTKLTFETTTTIWDSINANKTIFLEPKFSKEMKAVITEYNKAIERKDKNGAMFFAVARGKVSEGLDFSDNHARAVVVIGLPYPNLGDPKVRLKYMYFDSLAQDKKNDSSNDDDDDEEEDKIEDSEDEKEEKDIKDKEENEGDNDNDIKEKKVDEDNNEIKKESENNDKEKKDDNKDDDDDNNKDEDVFDGTLWYTQQAMRAVNQSVGRVIRHIKDYGAIILCDERFSAEKNKHMMSAWLRPSLTSYTSFGQATKSLTQFFRVKSPTAAQLEHEEKIRKQILEAKAVAAKKQPTSAEIIHKLQSVLDKDSYKHLMWLLRKIGESAKTAPEKIQPYLKEVRKILLETDNEHLFPELMIFLPAKVRDGILNPPPPKIPKTQ